MDARLRSGKSRPALAVLGAAMVMLVGGTMILQSSAATYVSTAEAESGYLTGPAARCQKSGGTEGTAVTFGTGSCDPAGKTFSNPIATSIADPGVLRHDGRYYMVATSGCPCFDIFVSDDLVTWRQSGKSVFGGDGTHPWGTHSFWAPELHALGNGRFAVYYSAFNPAANRLQVGVATADNITGPYMDLGFPLVRESYGVIDVNFFRDDDGRQYLYWKEDGGDTRIFGQEIDVAGTTFIGAPKVVLQKGLAWEGSKGIEGTWVTKKDGQYYMFYSGELFSIDKYAVGVARAGSPLGTYTKKGDPILTSGGRWKGPGHNSIVRAGANDYIVYHAWDRNAGVGDRAGLVDKVTWTNGWPVIGSGKPTESAQPYPQ